MGSNCSSELYLTSTPTSCSYSSRSICSLSPDSTRPHLVSPSRSAAESSARLQTTREASTGRRGSIARGTGLPSLEEQAAGRICDHDVCGHIIMFAVSFAEESGTHVLCRGTDRGRQCAPSFVCALQPRGYAIIFARPYPFPISGRLPLVCKA